MNKSKYALLVGFLLVIFGIGIANLVDPNRDVSFYENRPLAQRPNPTLHTYLDGEYFSQYDTYYTDQFVARQTWIKLYSKWNYMIPAVYHKGYYVQKDNTILQEPLVRMNYNYYLPYTHQVNELAKWVKQNNEQFYFFMSPSKNVMLNPMLPSYMPKGGTKENEKDFISQLDKSINFINLADWFEKTYTPEQSKALVSKSDHHWNMEGAFIAYQKVVDRLKQDFPQLPAPYQKQDVAVKYAQGSKMYGSWAQELGFAVDTSNDIPYEYLPKNLDFNTYQVYQGAVSPENKQPANKIYGSGMDLKQEFVKYGDAYTYDYPELNIINPNSKNNLHMLVFKDSYFNPMIYLLASHVHQLSVLDMRYYDPAKIKDYIKNNHINIVMIFYNENNLSTDTYRFGM